MQAQEKQYLTKTNNKSLLKKLFTSILQDSQMTSQFVIDPNESKPQQITDTPQIKQNEEQQAANEDAVKEQEKNNISRLQIQIRRNKLCIVPVSGQVFLLLMDASLHGKKIKQGGKIMLTNYRVLFFKEGVKRVDLPFGLIAKVQYQIKQKQIVYHLKYPHSWKFEVISPAKYNYLKNIGELYYFSRDLRAMFAFQYALKVTPIPLPYCFSLQNEYKRLKFNQQTAALSNQNYSLCSTYPQKIYSVNKEIFNADLKSIACHRRGKRMAILAYKYSSVHFKNEVPIWISSAYEDTKTISSKLEEKYLKALANKLGLYVFVAESKSKTTDEAHFWKESKVNYLKLQTNDQLAIAERNLLEVFLNNKKPFIKQIISSKWYNYIANILYSCQLITSAVLQGKAILIRCQEGQDKSLLLSSLLQIILNPFFRTFEGFQLLVMRMFVHNGHPFSERLGLRINKQGICPIFLQFLDCISQLIAQNPSSFEFNFKYLSKISNLMQVGIYGTFIADNSQEYVSKQVEFQTCSIWPDLLTPVTTSGFYSLKGGVLNIASGLTQMRIWKQHFGNLISRSKDHYLLLECAQDNEDYLNLYSLNLKQENAALMLKMKQSLSSLQSLQKQLKAKKIE